MQRPEASSGPRTQLASYKTLLYIDFSDMLPLAWPSGSPPTRARMSCWRTAGGASVPRCEDVIMLVVMVKDCLGGRT